MNIADQAIRQQALDITHSFIVQAPAGSGKTELLSQRYLKLLAHVEKPEQVLAITFTRKAVTEMRERILSALMRAQTSQRPLEEPHATTYDLSRAVLKNDARYNWHLCDNPNRLSIQTIDSFCYSLAQQLPLLAKIGANLQISDDPSILYEQAAEQTLALMDESADYAKIITPLLAHLDNRYTAVKELVIRMLSHRDQWLPLIATIRHHANLKSQIEQSLQQVIEEILIEVSSLFPNNFTQTLLPLLRYAANNLVNTGSPIAACLALETLPQPDALNLKHWQGIAHLLLTADGTWRTRIDKMIGFPAATSVKDKRLKESYQNQKQSLQALLAGLSDNQALQGALIKVQNAPPLHYSNGQWVILDALLQLLPVACAKLHTIFQASGSVDFMAIAQAAQDALGDECEPTDLALQLDYRLQHILVDEFQDTSTTQLRLLEKLTQGWIENDGHSLFLVGDPMQSIYGFRAAEVGLFLQVQAQGLGQIQPIPLKLSVNFRSHPTLIEWFNTSFTAIFPEKPNIAQGAVTFSPSQALMAKQAHAEISLQHYDSSSYQAMAQGIVDTIQSIRQRSGTASIAILLRSRGQIKHWLPALQAAKIPYQATELENLSQLPIIQDLMALSFALLHLGDRRAWFALLRSPWCGLSLVDLDTLANTPPREGILWEQINNLDVQTQLSNEGQQRLSRIIPTLTHALKQRARSSFREWIESTWLALGGADSLQTAQTLEHSRAFFQVLDKLASSSLDANTLQTQLEKLYANTTQPFDHAVQIMTIHKAKGLEFDAVILPDLEQKVRAEPNALMLWMERPRHLQGVDLLLAPIKSTMDKQDGLYDFLKRELTLKRELETTRLLYVATTRAKSALYLFTTHLCETEPLVHSKLPQNSFLQKLTPCLTQFDSIAIEEKIKETIEAIKPPLYRLPANYQSAYPQRSSLTPTLSASADRWPSDSVTMPKAIGTVVHKILQSMSQQPKAEWITNQSARLLWQRYLQDLRLPNTQLAPSLDRIVSIIERVKQSQRAAWILNTAHLESYAEFPISGRIDDHLYHCVIDRSFVDKGHCWIIDYKTSTPDTDQPLKKFLAQEKRLYFDQLSRYGRLMQSKTSYPIRYGLYFPVVDGWIEWEM